MYAGSHIDDPTRALRCVSAAWHNEWLWFNLKPGCSPERKHAICWRVLHYNEWLNQNENGQAEHCCPAI